MGTGDHTVLGDNGQIVYVGLGETGAGNVLTLETTDTVAGTGGGDIVTSGNGDNVIALAVTTDGKPGNALESVRLVDLRAGK